MGFKINYVTTVWDGLTYSRNDPEFIKDRSTYIRTTINQLTHLRHDLDQITIMLPHNDERSPELFRYLHELPEGIKNTRLVVRECPNGGYSYKPLIRAWMEWPDFDYYIFVEDDYAPVKHNFDSTLIKIMNEEMCDYLASCVVKDMYGMEPHCHPSIANGVIRRDCFEDVCEKVYTDPGFAQVVFGIAFHRKRYRIADYRHLYSSPYWSGDGVNWNDPTTRDEIIVPWQVLSHPLKYAPPYYRRGKWPRWDYPLHLAEIKRIPFI
jgi:hypothetical protein